MNRIMRKEPLYIYGDGQQRRQFSYIEDSLPCILKCIDHCDNDTVNIGGTFDTTVEHIAFLTLTAMFGEDTPYPIKYLNDRYGEVKFAYCDPDKSIRLLGYKDTIGIEEGIKRMAAWAWRLGAQDWIDEPLAIPNKHTPTIWE